MLRFALSELHRAAPEPVGVIALPEGAPFGAVEIDAGGCTLCLSCVSACPTGALRDDPERPMLRFVEDACVQCGLCQATCPEHVITLKPQIDFDAARAPARILKQEEPFCCIRCSKPFGVKSTIDRVVYRKPRLGACSSARTPSAAPTSFPAPSPARSSPTALGTSPIPAPTPSQIPSGSLVRRPAGTMEAAPLPRLPRMRIHPNFTGGFNVSQPTVALPTDSFNQEQAVLDGIGLASTPPTNAQLNAVLKNAAGTAYPAGGTGSGVYVPYTVTGSPAVKTFSGGGIFVQGDAAVTLLPTTSSTTSQTYQIVQSGVTTTLTIDPAAGSAGTTTISTPGLGTQIINGVPQQMSSSGLSMGDATMLFVNGNITSLSGPGQGQASVQNGTALSIVASGSNNITVTGDILYKTEPVTMTGTPTSTPPIDQLIPANNTGQVLGLFTAGGNVYLNNSQSNGNLEIDASIATISATGSGAIVNNGAGINTLTIVGGRIQNTIQNIGATTRNVLFDRRFQSGGFAPPWFPATTVTPGAGVGNTVTAT